MKIAIQFELGLAILEYCFVITRELQRNELTMIKREAETKEPGHSCVHVGNRLEEGNIGQLRSPQATITSQFRADLR